MKKALIILFLCSIGSTVSGQEQATDSITEVYHKQNEIKVNALMLIIGAVEFNYEYLLNEESGIGISAFITYDRDMINDIDYYISPYYRYYFGKKYAGGFFLEGFGMFNRVDRNIDFLFFQNEEQNFVTDFALGIGLGAKWITKKGFVGEFNYGIGRNLFNTDESEFDFVGKAGISIGYRF